MFLSNSTSLWGKTAWQWKEQSAWPLTDMTLLTAHSVTGFVSLDKFHNFLESSFPYYKVGMIPAFQACCEV